MTLQELSDGFDVLVSSYRRLKDFDSRESLDSLEFNEYEKSVFLTKAQNELVTSLYNGRNSEGLSFEETEEMRRYLTVLVCEERLSPITTTTGKPLGMESASKFFTLPDNLWFITYEAVLISEGECDGHTAQDVIPVTQDEYHRIKRNPFRGANFRRALRLDLSDNVVEIVSKYNVTDYYVRYLRKPRPIILADLPNGLSVGGISLQSSCELNDSLHDRILEIAVALALRSKGMGMEKENNNREQ